MKSAPTLSTGAWSSAKASSDTRAAISAPTPNAVTASWATIRRRVFATDASTASSSQGWIERRSITSAAMPAAARDAAAFSAAATLAP